MRKGVDNPINIKLLVGCHIVHFKAILQKKHKTFEEHMHDSTDFSQTEK
jgi:hypothetical protein